MKRALCFLVSLCAMLSLASCGKDEPVVNSAEEFRIVTSFYPVYVATLNLVEGAENVTLINLVEKDTGCLHDYTLTTDDLKRVTGADLFIASGKNMEAFVGNVSLGIPRLEVLDCGEDISHTIEVDEAENSHYWMSISNAIEQCDKIKRTLVRMNPENAEVYERNAEEYKKKLADLKTETAAKAEALSKQSFVVYHDSFEYFADEFSLDVISITDIEEDEYTDAIAKNGCIFVQEDLAEDKDLRKIQKETGCQTYIIDTLTTGKDDAIDKDAYINAIRHNIDLFKSTLE